MNTPLNPTFIQKNWGFTWAYLFFLFLRQNIDCGYSFFKAQNICLFHGQVFVMPHKLAIWLASIKNNGDDQNKETDKINRNHEDSHN